MYPSNGIIINVLALTQIRVAAEGIRCGAACSEKNYVWCDFSKLDDS
jgi:hypothetical protein